MGWENLRQDFGGISADEWMLFEDLCGWAFGNFESVRLRTLRLCRENLTKQAASGAIGFCCFLARGATAEIRNDAAPFV
ncbi:hypothetical protein B2G52_05605 [Neisseria lactamica]|uniref:Phage associated protein n=2 Tax=Neisseriaceae TaxID=481 RepID=A0AAU8VSX4_NEILA|nr:hypothetical protein B2G52_05605 [Neisseria lactamica]